MCKRGNTKSKGLLELSPGEGEDYLHQTKFKGMAHVTNPICSTNWSQQDDWTGLLSPLPEPQESIPPGNGRRQDCLSWREWLGCVLHSFPALLWTVAWVRLRPLPRLSLGESQSRELLCIFSGGSAREVASLGRSAPFAAVLEVICERNGAGACWGQRTCKRAPASIAC